MTVASTPRPTFAASDAARTSAVPVAPRVALVTGGARRIGRAIALRLAGLGWDVAIHYERSHDAALETVADIEAMGRRAVALHASLADETATAALIARCTEALGVPVCLVNNASRFEYDSADDFGYKALERHMRVNAGAPLVLAREMHAALATLGESGRGVVVNLLDQKLANPNPDYLSYTLSKAALEVATTLLAQAFAPRLRVVGVAPGVTLLSVDQTPAGFAAAHASTPLGVSSTPEDIAQAVAYLAEAPAVTGTVLYVDGGQHLASSSRDVKFLTEPAGADRSR